MSAHLSHYSSLWFLAAGPPSAGGWQAAFGFGGILMVLFQAWRGWRSGIARQAMEIVAVICASTAGYFAAPFAAPFLRQLGYPNPILSVLGGAIVAITVFSFISIASIVLFKKTSQQTIGLIRLFYGLSGAGLGVLFGIFWVWVGMLGVRVMGTLAETQVRKPSNPLETRWVPGRAATAAPTASAAAPTWMAGLAQMKRSLDELGGLVQHVDPLPDKIYGIVGKMGTVLGNEQNVARFLSFPSVKPLAENPKIVALREDPDLVRAAQSWDWSALLQNPRLVQAANDPDVAAMLRKLDLEKALDYALGRAQNGR